MSDPLLSVRDLEKHYPIREGLLRREIGRIRAVDGVSFDVRAGETLGLIGESGSGKSTAATTALGLEAPTGGEVLFDGERVTDLDGTAERRFRRRTGVLFQQPDSSFDPRLSVGRSVAEPLSVQGLADADRRREIVVDLLERVGLSADDFDRYPHELSGGQKQRAALARALVLNPDLLVADEPVSALDVSVQAEILALLDDLQRDLDLAVLFISHNVGVVREICDRVAVMYLGEIVERGPTDQLLADPAHPYTQALVDSVPSGDPDAPREAPPLAGETPDPSDPPVGCRFHPRCPSVIQPEGYGFEQDHWRAVLDFRRRLAAGEVDPAALAERAAGTEADPDAVADAALRTTVRETYDLPSELADPDAEAVLAAAVEDVISGDASAAERRLAREFATVCEQRPATYELGSGREASCHLLDSNGGGSTASSAVESETATDD